MVVMMVVFAARRRMRDLVVLVACATISVFPRVADAVGD
jgi:hypothetical protein